MELVRAIRAEYGLDFVSDDAQASSAIQNLTHNLENACRRCVALSMPPDLRLTAISLGEELYSKSTHFVLELLQNADDNTYLEGETPTLILQLDKSHMTVWCNERGFSEQNVRAICSIGKSTKAGSSGYIGELLGTIVARETDASTFEHRGEGHR